MSKLSDFWNFFFPTEETLQIVTAFHNLMTQRSLQTVQLEILKHFYSFIKFLKNRIPKKLRFFEIF